MSLSDNNNSRPVNINTPRLPWKMALTNNSTATAAFVDGVGQDPTTTRPVSIDDSGDPSSNVAVIECKHTHTAIVWTGRETDLDEFRVRISLWTPLNAPTPLYMGREIGKFDIVITSSLPGVAGAPIVAADFVGHTIINSGTYDSDVVHTIYSPAADKQAQMIIDTQGEELLKVEFDIDGGGGTAATQANFMFRQF